MLKLWLLDDWRASDTASSTVLNEPQTAPLRRTATAAHLENVCSLKWAVARNTERWNTDTGMEDR